MDLIKSTMFLDIFVKALDENEKENKEEVYAIPLNENKAK